MWLLPDGAARQGVPEHRRSGAARLRVLPGTDSEHTRSQQIWLPEALGYLPSWREMVLGLLGEATAWEFTLQNNALLFSFSFFFYCRLRFLDCSGEHFLAKTLKGKQEGKLSSDKLLYFWKYSHFLALNTFFFFSHYQRCLPNMYIICYAYGFASLSEEAMLSKQRLATGKHKIPQWWQSNPPKKKKLDTLL